MPKKKPTIGTILPKETMILRTAVREMAEHTANTKYEITITEPDRSPLVRSLKTNKFYALNWADIVDMAINAGIDKP